MLVFILDGNGTYTNELFLMPISEIFQSVELFVCFVNHCLSFCYISLCHCIICPSVYSGIWLPLWYLKTVLMPTQDDALSLSLSHTHTHTLSLSRSLFWSNIWTYLLFWSHVWSNYVAVTFTITPTRLIVLFLVWKQILIEVSFICGHRQV